jgi:adenylate cyclase
LSIFKELKRRNVFRVGAAYVVASWLLIQVAETIFPLFGFDDSPARIVVIVLAIGFIPALVFSWAFEMTPEGLKKESEVDRTQSVTPHTGKQLDRMIMVVLALALGYFDFDKFVLTPQREAALKEENVVALEQARQQGRTEGLVESYGDQSIAVLPFVNMSSDEEQEYFSDGISEELLNLLAKIPELRVISRSSAFSYKGKDIKLAQVAEELNVTHILEGSVRKAGNKVRITAQLIEARSDAHLWSETYDRQLDDIFAIQDEIAATVVEQLKITLLGEAPKVRETDPEAYQLYLEGQFFGYQRTLDSMAKAIKLFKSALEIDPDYAPAWVELASNYLWYTGMGGMSIDEGNTLADQAIEMALSITPDYARAYLARGTSKIVNKFSFKAGFEDYQLALRLNPRNAIIVSEVGDGSRALGRFNEAIGHQQVAIELDPIKPEIYRSLGAAYEFSGRLDEAESAYRKVLTLSPLFLSGHYRLGRVLTLKGEYAAALAELELETESNYQTTGFAILHRATGNQEASDHALETLIIEGADTAAYQIAQVYAFRGEADEAFEWLERSLEIRDSGLAFLLGDPSFKSMFTDSRWQPFLEKLGLLEYWLEMPREHGGPG